MKLLVLSSQIQTSAAYFTSGDFPKKDISADISELWPINVRQESWKAFVTLTSHDTSINPIPTKHEQLLSHQA